MFNRTSAQFNVLSHGFNRRHGFFRFFHNGLHQGGNLFCLRLAIGRECLYFFSNNGKAFSLFAGTDGLDCRIDGKNVRLSRYVTNDVHDFLNLFTALAESLYPLYRFFRAFEHKVSVLDGAFHRLAAFSGGLICYFSSLIHTFGLS